MSSAVVIDFGTDTVKFGPAGDDAPQIFPSSLGTSSAINWDAVTASLERIFKDELQLDPATQNVFITDSLFQSNTDREALTRILFETFEVAGLYRMHPAGAALCAVGRTDGLVVDIGANSTQISPVWQGYAATAGSRLDIGGQQLSAYLAKLLDERGLDMSLAANADTLRDIKEKTCFVALNVDTELQQGSAPFDYISPAGQAITLNAERFYCPEILFNPARAGYPSEGIVQQIRAAIDTCDRFLRKTMGESIVLTGGSSMIEGLGQRLQQDLEVAMPLTRVSVTATPERRYLAWIGCSIMASMSSFDSNWITQDDYMTSGPSIIGRTCIPQR